MEEKLAGSDVGYGSDLQMMVSMSSIIRLSVNLIARGPRIEEIASTGSARPDCR